MSAPKTKPQPTITFNIIRDGDGFKWSATHANGHVLAESPETYRSGYEARLNLDNLIRTLKYGDYAVSPEAV